jgi:hypothetical protein
MTKEAAMKTYDRLGTILVTLLLALTVSAPARAEEGGKIVKVDCARGETIAGALDRGKEKLVLVLVKGICNESVTVELNDVTLQGDPLAAGSGVNGPDPTVDAIVVTGSRVTLEGLTITGGRNGVGANGAPGLTIRNATVQGTGRTGIVYAFGASGVVDGCTVRINPRDGVAVEAAQATIVNSTVTQNARAGILVTNNGSARIGVDNRNAAAGNTIALNGSNGVHVSLGSAAFIAMNQINGNGTDPAGALGRVGVNVINATADIIGGNTMSGNAGQGINARSASVIIGDPSFGFSTVNTVTGNGNAAAQGGVFGFVGSTMVIRDAVISGNNGFGLGLDLNSSGSLSSSTIQNNLPVGLSTGDGIRLIFGSGLAIAQPNTIVSGNVGFGLQCTDGESSVVNTLFLALSGNGLGGVSGACTGF